MHHLLSHFAHRPYHLAAGPWVMTQVWKELLFAHWAVPLEILQKVVPEELEIDTYEGQAYVGVVPFQMSAVRPRGLPAVSFLSEFLELNVRTYVIANGKPGVYFFSLDASNFAAVKIARALYHLPYFQAEMKLDLGGKATAGRDLSEGCSWITYSSSRLGEQTSAQFKALYRPCAPIEKATKNSLESFLTERYCLYVLNRHKRLHIGEIHHQPWLLQKAEAIIESNTMGDDYSFDFSAKPILHYSKSLETLEWPIRAV